MAKNYIITATEYLSKWAEAVTVESINADTVCDFILDIVSRFGCPSIIQTDQGREFCNMLNNILCDKLNIDHRISLAYHPQVRNICYILKICNQNG